MSVVVPTRNGPASWVPGLDSLSGQDFDGPWEIVVVDDGSTDDTLQIARGFADGCAVPTKVITQAPAGLNSARNAAIEGSGGDLIWFLDDDVLVPEYWLSEVVRGAGRHAGSGCFGAPIRLRLEGKAPRICDRDTLGETELDLGREEIESDQAFGANFGARRSAFEIAGMFDPDLPIYGEEQEWQRRFAAAGGIITYLPGPWVWHRRLADDLKLRKLIKGHVRRGRSFYVVAPRLGMQRKSVRQALKVIFLHSRHAVVGMCAKGLLMSAFWAGYLYEMRRRLPAGEAAE